MKIVISDKKITEHLVLLLIFFSIVAIQSWHVGFYHDDYGYASLSYAADKSFGPFSFANLIHYLRWHYLHWGGRVVPFFFGISAMQLGMRGYMLVQAGIVSLTLYLAVNIITLLARSSLSAARTRMVSAAVTLILYLFFQRELLENSMFWASASVLYVWPQLFFMTGLYGLVLAGRADSPLPLHTHVVTGSAFFLTGASQEQVSMAALLLVCSFFLCLSKEKRVAHKHLFATALACALAGAVFLFAAPGNYARAETANVFFSLASLSSGFAYNTMFILRSSFLPLTIAMAGLLWSLKEKRPDTLRLALLTGTAVLTFGLAYVLSLKGARILYPGIFLLLIASAVFLHECIACAILSGKGKTAYVLLAVALLLSASFHYRNVYLGYYRNYPTVIANDANLREAGEKLAASGPFSNLSLISWRKDGTPEVVFYKLPDDSYGDSMPYVESSIEPTLKYYYGLPQNTFFNYVESPFH